VFPLPYIRQPSISLGPITIHAFGVLVAIAMLVGMRIVRQRATAQGLDGSLADRLVTWILLGGFAGAHLVDRLVYYPAETIAEPIRLLRFWEGLSSFGGFLGAVVAAWLFFRRHHLPEVWEYLDAVAYGFPFGWIFGRTGCFLAFDHPGLPTDFFLGQQDGAGVVRHNLGLEEGLYTIVIAALFFALGGRRRPAGFFVGMLALLYAPVRFLFDFLRTNDVHYLGLTPGQWGALALLGVGVYLVLRAQKKGEAAASPVMP
jgi:phosphatidylglycerol:prolipoprotein diacylglycerol transferase